MEGSLLGGKKPLRTYYGVEIGGVKEADHPTPQTFEYIHSDTIRTTDTMYLCHWHPSWYSPAVIEYDARRRVIIRVRVTSNR